MPKGKVGGLEALAQYVKNKLPQVGFFSTLDELIANAPFERAPIEQWRNYLQPGRTFEREGVRFPLKKEELDYTLNDPRVLSKYSDLDSEREAVWDKQRLRQMIQKERPDLRLTLGVETGDNFPTRAQFVRRLPEEHALDEAGLQRMAEDPDDIPELYRIAPQMTQTRYPAYAHPHENGTYEESMTRSTNFGPETRGQHFGADNISHSRTTIQPVQKTTQEFMDNAPDKLMRLIEEIQSDRHQRAAERISPESWALTHPMEAGQNIPPPRRGYRTAADENELAGIPAQRRGAAEKISRAYNELEELKRNTSDWEDPVGQRRRQINQAVDRLREAKNAEVMLAHRQAALQDKGPDAPFKDPADYALLELKQQMLHAARQGQDYLGLVRGQDVSRRFGHDDEQAKGTAYTYDKVYRSQLEKLAKQYGIPVEEPSIKVVGQKDDTRPPTMQEMDWEDIPRAFESYLDVVNDTHPESFNTHLAPFNDLTNEMQSSLENAFPEGLPEQIQERFKAARALHDQVEQRHDAFNRKYQDQLRTGSDESELRGAVGDHWDRLGNGGIFTQYENALRALYEDYQAAQAGHVAPARVKTFPAMRLDPEIREKIKRVGVPIWSLGAIGAGLSMLQGEDEDPGFAEGGFLSDKLDALKAAWKRGQTGRDYLRSGILSQLEGLKENGEAGFDNPIGWKIEDGELVPYLKWRPGMVDELMSLPTLGGYVGLDSPDWAQEAAKRTERLHGLVRNQMELGDPDNFGDAALESLGMMMTQIPVPIKGESAMKNIGREASDFGGKVAGSPLEFLLPTVNPREPGNYLFGSGFGGILGMLGQGDKDSGKTVEDLVTQKKAEGGSVAPLQEMLDRLRDRFEELTPGMPDSSPFARIADEEETVKKAKGGKVGSLLELREALAKLKSPNVEGTGKELVPAATEKLEQLKNSLTSSPIPDSVSQMVENAPAPSAGSMDRRSFLQGAAGLLTPGDVPLSPEAALAKLVKEKLAPVEPEYEFGIGPEEMKQIHKKQVADDLWDLSTFTEYDEPDWDGAERLLRRYTDQPEGKEAMKHLQAYRDHWLSLDPTVAPDDAKLVEMFGKWDDALQELGASRGYRMSPDSGDFIEDLGDAE